MKYFCLFFLLLFQSCNFFEVVGDQKTEVSDNFFNDQGSGSTTPPNAPAGVSLTAPTYSPGVNPRPIITVSGVTSGDTVHIYAEGGQISTLSAIC